jgi:hypothetical protein
MKRFEEWLEINHPESLDEGWRDVARNVAIGGALMGAGMGLGKAQGADYKDKKITNSSNTASNASDFLAKPNSDSDASDYFPNLQKNKTVKKSNSLTKKTYSDTFMQDFETMNYEKPAINKDGSIEIKTRIHTSLGLTKGIELASQKINVITNNYFKKTRSQKLNRKIYQGKDGKKYLIEKFSPL